MGAYEQLWLNPKASFKSIAELFSKNPGATASDLVDKRLAQETADKVIDILNESNIKQAGFRFNHTNQYPQALRHATHPVEFLYYLGTWELVESPKAIAIVGARKASEAGVARAKKLVKQLVDLEFTIVSGLAAGIDTVAHETAIECGGKTIAVIGTPINECYPKHNKQLQTVIARDYLLVSQVPVLRYRSQDWRFNRLFFPERNKTMSALTQATVIVEASDTSGTLVQARAALQQGRKLFILNNCFENKAISWPAKYEKQGAIRVETIEDIRHALNV